MKQNRTFATCSNHRPSEIKTISIGGTSKNVIGLEGHCKTNATVSTSNEYTNAIVVANTIKTSIFVVPWRKALKDCT